MTLGAIIPFWADPAGSFSVVFRYYVADTEDSYYRRGITWGEADIDAGLLQQDAYFYAQDAAPETGTLSFPPVASIKIVQP